MRLSMLLLHSSPPNCPLQYWMSLNYIIPSCLWLFYSCFLLLFLKCAHLFRAESWIKSSHLLWESRNPKELGGVSIVRMRRSLGIETKGGRWMAVLAHLSHSFTAGWEVEDISDKKERSLKELKTGSFQQAGRISKNKEKRPATCISKKYNPLSSFQYVFSDQNKILVWRTVLFFPYPSLGSCGRHLLFLSVQSLFPISSVNNTSFSSMEGSFPILGDCYGTGNPNFLSPHLSSLATGIGIGPKYMRQFLILLV